MGKFSGQPAENNQLLLGAIRQKESSINRQLAAARDAAEKEVAAAQLKARQIIDQAVEDGRLEGEAAFKEALSDIEQEAAEIETQARKEAEASKNLAEETLNTAVNQIIKIITGSNP